MDTLKTCQILFRSTGNKYKQQVETQRDFFRNYTATSKGEHPILEIYTKKNTWLPTNTTSVRTLFKDTDIPLGFRSKGTTEPHALLGNIFSVKRFLTPKNHVKWHRDVYLQTNQKWCFQQRWRTKTSAMQGLIQSVHQSDNHEYSLPGFNLNETRIGSQFNWTKMKERSPSF